MDAEHHPLVPAQYQGIQKDFYYPVTASDMDEAASWFLDIKDNLLDVNNWTADKNSQEPAIPNEDKPATHILFALADNHKKPLHRKAHTHDMVQLQPHQYHVGDVWCYALIDVIEYDYDPDTDYESIGMRICPSCHNEADIVGKTGYATITFVCDRRNTQLSATCHLRNMEPDINGAETWSSITDKQWLNLLKSFVAG